MKKTEFKNEVTKIALECITKYIVNKLNTSAIYKLSIKGGTVWVSLHRYGEELHILAHGNGNITLRFFEFCHSKLSYSYYVYNETDDHEALLDTLSQDLDMLIADYIEQRIDYHILLDYLESDIDENQEFIKLNRTSNEWVEWYERISFY